jgi:hypothetical protein
VFSQKSGSDSGISVIKPMAFLGIRSQLTTSPKGWFCRTARTKTEMPCGRHEEAKLCSRGNSDRAGRGMNRRLNGVYLTEMQGILLVKRWAGTPPASTCASPPTSCFWLNMVERFFRDLTEKPLRRGVFRNVEELLESIGEYIDNHNRQPKPFIRTAKGSDILEKTQARRG